MPVTNSRQPEIYRARNRRNRGGRRQRDPKQDSSVESPREAPEDGATPSPSNKGDASPLVSELNFSLNTTISSISAPTPEACTPRQDSEASTPRLATPIHDRTTSAPSTPPDKILGARSPLPHMGIESLSVPNTPMRLQFRMDDDNERRMHQQMQNSSPFRVAPQPSVHIPYPLPMPVLQQQPNPGPWRSSTQVVDPSKTPIDPTKYKTKMCRNFERTGICSYEHTCCFAHGPSELRDPNPNNTVQNLPVPIMKQNQQQQAENGEVQVAQPQPQPQQQQQQQQQVMMVTLPNGQQAMMPVMMQPQQMATTMMCTPDGQMVQCMQMPAQQMQQAPQMMVANQQGQQGMPQMMMMQVPNTGSPQQQQQQQPAVCMQFPQQGMVQGGMGGQQMMQMPMMQQPMGQVQMMPEFQPNDQVQQLQMEMPQ